MLLLQHIPQQQWNQTTIFLMFSYETVQGWLTHLNNCSRYYGDNKGKIILAELHKLWKHHEAYVKDIQERWLYPCKPKNNNTLEIGQPIMVENYACHDFEPKSLMAYRVLKKLNDSTLLLVTPNDREKININDVKPCITLQLITNTWNLLEVNHLFHSYDICTNSCYLAYLLPFLSILNEVNFAHALTFILNIFVWSLYVNLQKAIEIGSKRPLK